MEQIEVLNALANLAEMTRVFFSALSEQGFNESQALQLTTTWLAAMSSGKAGES